MATRTAKRDRATQLVISQLADSPQYLDLIAWVAEQFDGVDDILHYIGGINIDNAKGVWLDLIGLIAGQSRTIPTTLSLIYFGFDGQPNSVGFGQARFYEAGDPLQASSILADEEYRSLLKAQVARNFGTVDKIGLVEAVQELTQVDDVVLSGAGNGEVTVTINGAVTNNVKEILANLDALPRTADSDIIIVYGA